MLRTVQEVLLTPIADVRLQGFYSAQSNGKARGVVMLLHGWEGSVDSAYILGTGKFLYNNGYSVFRLNYRDHGETHHLIPGLFYAVLLDEVFHAVQQVSEYEKELPFYLIGFSMGGNFALRIARRESMRTKGRSLLVLALIMLPVLVVTVASTLLRTADVSKVESIPREMGSATLWSRSSPPRRPARC